MNLRSDYALVGGPRYGGVLQPAQQAQQAPDCDARVTALCKASSNALDSEAGSTFALQREAEALRSDCEALSARAAAMRAEMATLVAEVDVLSAADKRADAELQDAKAEYDKKVQEHQLLLARECRLEEEERRLEESFVQKLEELEDKFNAAHAELEIALHKYNSVAGKEARKTERVAVDKKSLELERVQDLINQAKRRKLCMLIADAEAKTKTAA